MAKQSKPAPVVAPVVKKAKKVGGAKILSVRDIPQYKSKKETPLYSRITEAERISEGTRPPFAAAPNFKKTEEERAAWRKVHSNAKGPTSSLPRPKKAELNCLFIVHLKNKAKDPAFKTTVSFQAKKSELGQILYTFFHQNNRNIADEVKPEITKCFFNGRPYIM